MSIRSNLYLLDLIYPLLVLGLSAAIYGNYAAADGIPDGVVVFNDTASKPVTPSAAAITSPFCSQDSSAGSSRECFSVTSAVTYPSSVNTMPQGMISCLLHELV
jgi:hypothetical protein